MTSTVERDLEVRPDNGLTEALQAQGSGPITRKLALASSDRLGIGHPSELLASRRRSRRGRSFEVASFTKKSGSAWFAVKYAVISSSSIAIFAALFATGHVLWPRHTEALALAAVKAVSVGGAAWADEIQLKLDCAKRRRVVDQAGLHLGWLRPATACVRRGEATAEPAFRTAALAPDEAARFAEIVAVVEGEHRAGPATLAGVNLLGLARAVAALPAMFLGEGALVGGSNGMLTGLKNVNGEPGSLPLGRRLTYLWLTMKLAAFSTIDDAARDQWVALTLPAARGGSGSAFGPPVAGGLLPRVVFGKDSFADLSTGELCVLAAALRRNLLIVSSASPDGAREAARERAQEVRARAIERCVEPLLESGRVSADAAEAMRADIAALAFPVGQDAAQVNPDLDLKQSVPGARSLIADYVALAPPADDGAPIFVTLDRSVQARLSGWMAGFESRLVGKLSRELCLAFCGPNEMAPDLMAVVVELDDAGHGEIVAAFQNKASLFIGPTEIDGHGRAGPIAPTRSLGSAPKLLVAPLALMEGLGAICKRERGDLREADGSRGADCSDPAQFMSLPTLIARSSNLGYAEVIDRIGPATVSEWLALLGATVQPRPSDAALIRSIATGENAVITPQRYLQALAALARGATGRAPSAARATLFAGVPPLLDARLDLSDDKRARVGLVEAAPVFRAPIFDRRGTLRNLRDPLLGLGCRLSHLFGKTGSSDAAGRFRRGVRDKIVALYASCRGREFVLFALVGSPRVEIAVGRVQTRDVGAFALAALDAALLRSRPDERL